MSKAAEVSKLWDLATDLLPTKNLKATMPAYTQALMDLGATVCHARSPECGRCPVVSACKAKQDAACGGLPIDSYPVKTKKIKRSTESIWLLQALKKDGAVYLEQKPMSGVWAGLYSFPSFAGENALVAALPSSVHSKLQFESAFKHVLTHKDLWLHVVQAKLPANAKLANSQGRWYPIKAALQLGLPAPIKKLLEQLPTT
jgi:A/G-specific adenine glycosylase